MSETKDISLIERESNTGVLVTNIEELEKFISEKLTEYTPENYKGDSDAAKKDRATLNASKKAVSAKRIDIIKNAMARFCIDVFETRCKKVEKDIDTAALALDAIVKIKEDAEKAEKLKQIEAFWTVQNFDLVKLDAIFDPKWLNKGSKNKDIFEEIETKISKIYADIKTIEAFGVDIETLKPIYLDTLDLGATISQGNRIKENRERLAKEETERKEREATKAKNDALRELAEDCLDDQKNAPIASMAAAAAGIKEDNDPVIQYTLKFKAKKSVLFALRQYMIDNGIEYEKMEQE